MRSDIIQIDNQGNGFARAVEETRRVARYQGMDQKQSLRLQLCTEEMLSLARSVTGELNASFYMECEGKKVDLHMTTKTVMDKEKRYNLLSSASSRKNEAANSFIGKLRDAFEQAMLSGADHTYYELPDEVAKDFTGQPIDDPEWDRYEQSTLRRLADDVKIGIRGGVVDMTVTKHFE